MNTPMQDLKDDIAFMRALAQEGRTTPPLGGAILMLAGVIFGLGSIGQWAVLSGLVNLAPAALIPMWIATTVLFLVLLVVLRVRLKGKPGAYSPTNKANGAVWQGVGIAIFTTFVALTAATWATHDMTLVSFSPSIILLFYGVGWTVSQAMTGQAWARLPAYGSFVGAVALACLINSPQQYLAYAACLFLLAALPGWLQMRQEPSDLV